jgi:type II secretory pathway pseudopilin PulG
LKTRYFARAFSLLEILVAISLLGGAILVVLGLFPTAYSSLIQARDTTAALHTARQVLDSARGTPFVSLNPIVNAPVNVTSQVNGADVITQYFYDLTLTPSQPQASLYYEAGVTIRWNSGSVVGSGTAHSVRLDTVIQNR